MSASPPLWRWAVEDDQPRTGTEDELIRQLASGRLPPFVLVWREGWGEWLPAMQVAALSEAFPEAQAFGTRTARPSSVPGVPPVPVSDYPRLRHLAKVAPLGWPDGFEGPEQEVITSEVPAAALLEAARVMTDPSPPRDLGLQEAIERASRTPQHFSPFNAFDEDRPAPPSRSAVPLAEEFGLQGLLEESGSHRTGSWFRAHGLWIALAAITLGLGVTFALRHWGVPEPQPTPLRAVPPQGVATSQHALLPPTADGVEPRVVPASATLEPAPPPVESVCRFRHPPVSIDDWAVVDVRPLMFTQADGAKVVLGYAQSHKSATGGLLDVESLELTRRYWQQDDHQIFSVTPLGTGAKATYHVERMGANLAFGRALDGASALRIGMNDEGVVLGRLDQRPLELWDLPAGSRISVPEVVAQPSGFTLATRVGRDVGHLRLGLLDVLGTPLSPLSPLGPEAWDFGRPALASSAEQTALAVTRRAGPELPDALFLARANNGHLPAELEPFEVPSGGEPELLAPVLAAMPDGGFALMWSQGAGSRRVVRLQHLSARFEPQSPVFDVTSPDPALGGAMSAALHWAGDRLLVFYFLRRDVGHSLWVGSVSCGA